MSTRVLAQKLMPQKFETLQKSQYSEIIVISDTIAAGSEKMCKASIGNHGAFLLQNITGSFSSIKKHTNNNPIDTGVCYLSGKLSDQTGQRHMFNDYVPLNLFLSPGRVKSPVALNNNGTYDGTVFIAGDSSPLFYPFGFEYWFPRNTEILFYVKNSSDYENSFSLMLNGIRVIG